MKTNTLLSTFTLVCAMTASAWAMSAGTSASQGSVFNKESQKTREDIFKGAPTWLGFGGYYSQQKRGIDDGGGVQDWKVKHTVGYVTVDIVPWLTLVGGAGESDLTRNEQSSDGDAEWIAGGTLRLLNYFAMDPIVGEDPYWLSINLDGQYTDATAGDISWNEFYSALLFNLMARTERWGFMDSVSLYLGPAFSVINGSSDFSGDFSEDQTFGFAVGLAFCPNDNMTIKAEMQKFDDISWGVGASFHF